MRIMRNTSRLCAGDWLEVRSRSEILATLGSNGELDEMPFMPEIVRVLRA